MQQIPLLSDMLCGSRELVTDVSGPGNSGRVRPLGLCSSLLAALGNVALTGLQQHRGRWMRNTQLPPLSVCQSPPPPQHCPRSPETCLWRTMSEAEQAPASAPEAAAAAVLDALNATDSNGTEALNATAKFVATPEGTALAYGSLMFMALLPIFFGALRSVTCSKSKVTEAAVLLNKPRRGGFTSAPWPLASTG